MKSHQHIVFAPEAKYIFKDPEAGRDHHTGSGEKTIPKIEDLMKQHHENPTPETQAAIDAFIKQKIQEIQRGRDPKNGVLMAEALNQQIADAKAKYPNAAEVVEKHAPAIQKHLDKTDEKDQPAAKDALKPEEVTKLQEEAKTIKPEEFLKKDKKSQLAMVTEGGETPGAIKPGKEITFKFDEAGNEDLYKKTTLGTVMPANVRAVEADGVKYIRRGMTGEFFNEQGVRLKIHNGTKVKVASEGGYIKEDSEEFKKLQDAAKAKADTAIKQHGVEKGHKFYERYNKVAQMASEKGVDPQLALLLAKSKSFNAIADDKDFLPKFEDALTEFHRGTDGSSKDKIYDKDGNLNLNEASNWIRTFVEDNETGKEILKAIKNKEGKALYDNKDIEEAFSLTKATQLSKAEFAKFAWEQGKKVEAKYPGVPTEAVFATAGLESGWGTSSLAKDVNAVFGIGGNNGKGRFSTGDGHTKRGYDSLEASFMDYGSFLQGKRYKGIVTKYAPIFKKIPIGSAERKPHVRQFLTEIAQAGYNPKGATYAGHVMKMLEGSMANNIT